MHCTYDRLRGLCSRAMSRPCQSSDLRMRELAAEIGITERAVQRIVEDLTVSGYLVVTKEGRRNRYKLEEGMRLPHRVESHRSVGELVRFLHPE